MLQNIMLVVIDRAPESTETDCLIDSDCVCSGRAPQAVTYSVVNSFQTTSQWCYNEGDGVSNHRGINCLLNRLLRRRSKEASKLRVTGLCTGNSLGTGEYLTKMASNAENVSIWWRHHDSTSALLSTNMYTSPIHPSPSPPPPYIHICIYVYSDIFRDSFVWQ